MRSKEEIQEEIVGFKAALQRQEKLMEIANQLITEYKAKIKILEWMLANEEQTPIRTEGTR
ncbi:unnamed protein product [marine sediment metagenome]|uniref:Uncharacterized protein n=1 Tax=marine sediment metagenome TaxID=412755 RepID=X1KH12_9ZZZZ